MMARIAIVTGAGSGIGKAAALALLESGWRVALAGRRLRPLQDAAGPYLADGRALVIATDVCDEPSVCQLFAQVAAHWGRVDLLFNNAGVGGPNLPIEDIPLKDWRAAVDTNLTGMFLCLREAFRTMSQQVPSGGRVINNGSLAAHAPRPHTLAYSATKHAVTGLTRAASLDGRRHRIAVGQIDIGNAATDLVAAMTRGVPQADGRLAPEPVMDVALVGSSVRYMAELPLEANVLFHTVMATSMPFVGRG